MDTKKTIKEARKSFVSKYGRQTRDIVRYLTRGWTSHRIADKFGVTVPTVATYKANLTRGAYAPFAYRATNGTYTGTTEY